MSYVTYQFETNIATYDTELEAEVIEQIEAEKNYVKVYETTDRQGQLIHRPDYYHDVSSGELIAKKMPENPMTPMYEAGIEYANHVAEEARAEITALQETTEGRLALKILHNINAEDWEEWHRELDRNPDGSEKGVK